MSTVPLLNSRSPACLTKEEASISAKVLSIIKIKLEKLPLLPALAIEGSQKPHTLFKGSSVTLFAKDKTILFSLWNPFLGLVVLICTYLHVFLFDPRFLYLLPRKITGIWRMTGKSDMLSCLFDAPWASSYQCFYLANNDPVYGRHVLSLRKLIGYRKGLCITQIKNQYSSAQIATQYKSRDGWRR